MSFAAFESKIEDMAHAMLDHAEITKGLKEKVAEGEAKVEGAVKSVEEKIASAKDEILGEVHKIVDDFRAEILGGFDKVETDTVEKAKDAVAALKGDDAAAAPEPAPAPSETPVDAAPSEALAPAAPTSVNDIVAADVPEAHPDHIAAAVVAHSDAIEHGSSPEIAHADATASAAAAGAEPEVAVKIADAIATIPVSADPAPAAL